MSHILVVDDEPADLNLARRSLEKQEHKVLSAGTAKEAIQYLRNSQVDVVVLDVMLPDGDGLDVLRKIRDFDKHLPVILMTSSSDSSTSIRAMKHGALDYLFKPIDVAKLRSVVGRALEIRRLTEAPVEIAVDTGKSELHSIIGRCSAMQDVYKSIGIVAGQDVTVLIRGESGTGKELVARALYQFGERVQGPFLAVNCAAIPEALLESELFGHEKGAFTSADRKRIGKFEQSAGGTLFLDEIGDMSPVLQSKLLRVLQEKQFERVGGNETIKADVRVIAATHRNLEKMVADGQFRADLYYRLNGFTITLPPLRDRGKDLDLLIEHFRRHACRDLDKDVRVIAPDAMRALKAYAWPGNIRELQNVVRQAVLRTPGAVLLPDFLPDLSYVEAAEGSGTHQEFRSEQTIPSDNIAPKVLTTSATDLSSVVPKHFLSDSPNLYEEVIGEVEQRLVQHVLTQTDGDKTEAARRLGINPALLRSRAALELLDLESLHETGHASPFIRPCMTLAEIEAEAIRRALDQTEGCRKKAAKMLGVSTRTVQRRVKELGI